MDYKDRAVYESEKSYTALCCWRRIEKRVKIDYNEEKRERLKTKKYIKFDEVGRLC